MILTVTAGPTSNQEDLTPGKARYTAAQARWVFDGTDLTPGGASLAGNTITVHNGSSPAGQVIWTSAVDGLGNYLIDTGRGSTIPPAACAGDPANVCATVVSRSAP